MGKLDEAKKLFDQAISHKPDAIEVYGKEMNFPKESFIEYGIKIVFQYMAIYCFTALSQTPYFQIVLLNAFKNILLDIAINQEVILSKQDQYGTQYDIKFLITTEVGTFLVILCWILRIDEDFPRLTNAYPVNK
jgi:hypothetical protein